VSYLLPTKHERTDVENKSTLGYTIFGEAFNFAGNDIPANHEDFTKGAAFWALAEKLLAEGKLKVHPPKVEKGGLKGVFDGMKQLKEGKVSGTKLVYQRSGRPHRSRRPGAISPLLHLRCGFSTYLLDCQEDSVW